MEEQRNQYMALSQIIFHNPVLNASVRTRRNYIKYLTKYQKIAKWENAQFADEQMSLYRNVLERDKTRRGTGRNIKTYAMFLFLDLLMLTGYDKNILCSAEMEHVVEKFIADFRCSQKQKEAISQILSEAKGCGKNWDRVYGASVKFLPHMKDYIELTKRNISFKNTTPLRIAVTATMSAGKSTLVNAITGRNISLSQNLACTSKIHYIVGKTFDDGFSYKYDYDLALQADEGKLLKNNENNPENEIWAGIYYNGFLGGKRIVICDSPGVNFSGDSSHKKVAEELLKGKGCGLILYIMNASQLGTNDDEKHLKFVKEICAHDRILFVINQIDRFNTEEDDFAGSMGKTKTYLEQLGFIKPRICPVSAKAGYLAKKSLQTELVRIERVELQCLIRKFEGMDLPGYYRKHFPMIHLNEPDTKEQRLMKNCGLSYIEKMIYEQYTGGNY